MRRLLAAGAIALVASLVSYAVWRVATEPDSGTVTEKYYRGAYVSNSCYGKPVHCHTVYHRECYRITYRASNGRTGDDCVSPGEYDRIKKGDHYSR